MIKEETKEREAQCIASIQWNPLNNGEIAYMDNTGQFGIITDIFDSDNNILERDVEADEGAEADIDFGDSKCTFN